MVGELVSFLAGSRGGGVALLSAGTCPYLGAFHNAVLGCSLGVFTLVCLLFWRLASDWHFPSTTYLSVSWRVRRVFGVFFGVKISFYGALPCDHRTGRLRFGACRFHFAKNVLLWVVLEGAWNPDRASYIALSGGTALLYVACTCEVHMYRTRVRPCGGVLQRSNVEYFFHNQGFCSPRLRPAVRTSYGLLVSGVCVGDVNTAENLEAWS